MYERDILVIQEYMKTYLQSLEDDYPPCEFEIQAYSYWGAESLVERLMAEEMKQPLHNGEEPIPTMDIIQEFILDMDYYCSEAETTRQKLIFSIARDIGQEIELLFERRTNE